MRLSQKLSATPLLTAFLTSTAGAQTVVSTLAELGDSHTWIYVSFALAAATVATGLLWLVALRKLARQRGLLRELERNASHHEKTATILKGAHEDLELRVRDRTADLEMSYQKLNDVRDSLQAANERLESLARVDELTGVGNRRQFEEALETEIKRTLRSRQPVSLIVAELDTFESYRRHYGRDRGDAALRQVATEVEKIFRRAPDIVARHDEHGFAVILPETDMRNAMRFAERLREVVWQRCIPFPESEFADRLTVSVGLATMQPDRLYSPGELLAGANRALVAAQQGGRNAVEYGSIAAEEAAASEA